MSMSPCALAELSDIGQQGRASGGPTKSEEYNVAEGVAEYMHGWMLHPTFMEKTYPNAHEYLMGKLNPKFIKDIRDLGNDIRRFHGASATEQIGSHVKDIRPEQRSFFQQVANLFKKDDTPGFKLTRSQKFQALVSSDDELALKLAIKEGKAGREFRESEDPEILRTKLRYSPVKAAIFQRQGIQLPDGTRISEGFAAGLRALDAAFDDIYDGVKQRDVYRIAKRTVEAHDRGIGKGGPITGASGTDVGEMDFQQAEKALEEFKNLSAAKRKAVLTADSIFRGEERALLDYQVAQGRISRQLANKYIATNQEYGSFRRVMDSPDMSHMKRLVGGSSTLRGPTLALFDSYAPIIYDADRAQFRRSFVDLMQTPGRGLYEKGVGRGDIAAQVPEGTKGAKPVYRDGKTEYWKFQTDVEDAFDGFAHLPPKLMKVLGLRGDLLRLGIGLSPKQVIRNHLHDVIDNLTNSSVSSTSQLRERMKVYGNLTHLEANLNEFYIAGGGQSSHMLENEVSYALGMQKMIREVRKDPNSILYFPKKMLGKYVHITEHAESVGRLAEFNAQYKKAISEGKSHQDALLRAGYEARELLNFGTAGALMRVVNRIIPFTNVRIQGLKRQFRTFQERPGTFLARSMVFSIIPTVLMHSFNESANATQEYNKLPLWRRLSFWNFKVAPNFWLTIPKGFSGMATAMLAELTHSKMTGDKSGTVSNYTVALAQQFSPLDESALIPVFSPLAEAAMNRDVFRGREIVPSYEAELNLNLRPRAKSTSRIGNAIQDFVEWSGMGDTYLGRRFGDARIAEHVILGFGGNLADLGIGLSDVGRTGGGRPLTAARTFGIGTTAPIYEATTVQEVFSYARANGISPQNRKLKQLKSRIDAYYSADSDEAKDTAAKAIFDLSDKLQTGIEQRGTAFFEQKSRKKKKG